jgi:hypothetical protein
MNKRQKEILTAVSHKMKIRTAEKKAAIHEATKEVFAGNNSDLTLTLGQALETSPDSGDRARATGLMLAAALMGEKSALNSCALTLCKYDKRSWKRALGVELLLIASRLGDRTAMWNLFLELANDQPERAAVWMLKSRPDKDDQIWVNRFIKKNGYDKKQIQKLKNKKPW